MTCELEPAHPEGVLYRLGRQPDPWAWPDWTHAGELGTFDNRYDDPRGEYRVLYASSERLAPFLETLARFRADPAITSVEIAEDPRDEDFPSLSPGTVPQGWLDGRILGTARYDAAFADVGHARSLAYLRDALASVVCSPRARGARRGRDQGASAARPDTGDLTSRLRVHDRGRGPRLPGHPLSLAPRRRSYELGDL